MIFITHEVGSDAAIGTLMTADPGRVISTGSCAHGTNEIYLAGQLARALETES